MRSFATAVIVSTAAALIALADDARACGTWSLEDHDKNARVVFHASTVSIAFRDAKQPKRDIIRIDDAGTAESVHSVPHGWTRHTPPPPEHTFDGRKLLHHGKAIGALTDTGFTIHGVDYVVTTERVKVESHPADDVDIEPQWVVSVKREEPAVDAAPGVVPGERAATPVLSGIGRTICFGENKPTDNVQHAIMLRRIAIYLAVTRL